MASFRSCETCLLHIKLFAVNKSTIFPFLCGTWLTKRRPVGPVFTEKRPTFTWKSPYPLKTPRPADDERRVSSQIHSKEPCIHSKETYIHLTFTWNIHSKPPYIHTQKRPGWWTGGRSVRRWWASCFLPPARSRSTSPVGHDSFICVTWLVYMCDMTRS